MNVNLAALLYLVAGVLFIMALRGLSSPASSRQGNRFGTAGMVIAILTTLALRPPASKFSWFLVILGFAIGGGFGAWRARTVQMTAMPKRLPCREVAGEDRPRSARMNRTPATR